MQYVTAFSRPQTVPAVPTAAPRRTLWILGSWRDLILYVGTPLLLVPMFALAQARWSAQDIYIFVADRLHMNEKGYELWKKIVGDYLDRPSGTK